MAAINTVAAARPPRAGLNQRSTGVLLRLVPSVSAETRQTHRFFAIFASILTGIGFLTLLTINILLAQDAFTLSELKSEAKIVSDQREAINREIEAVSSPASLAEQAKALGMRPSESPVFLNLDAPKKAVGNLEQSSG